ncbi:MAG: hypothetical protein IIA63_12300 [Nitrospinae bacterium]|nr:hypothetical protein [Nitrospinota bacterium]
MPENIDSNNKLAKFAAEFVKPLLIDMSQSFLQDYYHEKPYDFFHCPYTAPILAHLAKREMEKRECEYRLTSKLRINYKGETIRLYETIIWLKDYSTFTKEDENEYIALWITIKEAILKEKNA